MTPKEFELMVQQRLAARLAETLNEAVPVHHLKKYTSLTGNTYEIDLSYEYSILGMRYLTLIECKHWNSFITREKITAFNAIIDDLKAHKGIVITGKGFQSGAIGYAKTQGIGLIKISNDNEFESFVNKDGNIKEIENRLSQEGQFDPLKPIRIEGLFSPSDDGLSFLAQYHSKALADYLRQDFDPGILDDTELNLPVSIIEALSSLPIDWYKNFLLAETVGLNYKINNEPDFRKINRSIVLLRFVAGS